MCCSPVCVHVCFVSARSDSSGLSWGAIYNMQVVIVSGHLDSWDVPGLFPMHIVCHICLSFHARLVVSCSLFGNGVSEAGSQGAIDDGGGAVISWQVLRALKQLGLRPKRTIRAIMWACEEMGTLLPFPLIVALRLDVLCISYLRCVFSHAGGQGGLGYFNTHKDEANNIQIIMEAGSFVRSSVSLSFNLLSLVFSVLRICTFAAKNAC